MKVFITGCAKSGTTLLRRLFLAFSGVEVLPNETSLYGFLGKQNEKGILVGKRQYGDIFSSMLADATLLKAVSLLLNNPQIKIVNIYRDGRDVVESGIKPSRWIASIRQMLNYGSLISANVRYEDLVKSPDDVQAIVARELMLESKFGFSEYPKFFQADHVSGQKKYSPRPISTDRIGKDLELYKQRVTSEAERRTFENLLRSLAYEN